VEKEKKKLKKGGKTCCKEANGEIKGDSNKNAKRRKMTEEKVSIEFPRMLQPEGGRQLREKN